MITTSSESKYKIDLEKYPDCRPLLEEASGLIKLGKRPVITFGRGVNFAVRSKQPFKGYRLQLLKLYGDPFYATGLFLHEAAHGLMMEQNGERNVRVCGPDISFGKNGLLFPSAARVHGELLFLCVLALIRGACHNATFLVFVSFPPLNFELNVADS